MNDNDLTSDNIQILGDVIKAKKAHNLVIMSAYSIYLMKYLIEELGTDLNILVDYDGYIIIETDTVDYFDHTVDTIKATVNQFLIEYEGPVKEQFIIIRNGIKTTSIIVNEQLL